MTIMRIDRADDPVAPEDRVAHRLVVDRDDRVEVGAVEGRSVEQGQARACRGQVHRMLVGTREVCERSPGLLVGVEVFDELGLADPEQDHRRHGVVVQLDNRVVLGRDQRDGEVDRIARCPMARVGGRVEVRRQQQRLDERRASGEQLVARGRVQQIGRPGYVRGRGDRHRLVPLASGQRRGPLEESREPASLPALGRGHDSRAADLIAVQIGGQGDRRGDAVHAAAHHVCDLRPARVAEVRRQVGD